MRAAARYATMSHTRLMPVSLPMLTYMFVAMRQRSARVRLRAFRYFCAATLLLFIIDATMLPLIFLDITPPCLRH